MMEMAIDLEITMNGNGNCLLGVGGNVSTTCILVHLYRRATEMPERKTRDSQKIKEIFTLSLCSSCVQWYETIFFTF